MLNIPPIAIPARVEPLKIDYDQDRDIVTIEGIRYRGALFRGLGHLPIGAVIRIDNREDGLVVLTQLRPGVLFIPGYFE